MLLRNCPLTIPDRKMCHTKLAPTCKDVHVHAIWDALSLPTVLRKHCVSRARGADRDRARQGSQWRTFIIARYDNAETHLYARTRTPGRNIVSAVRAPMWRSCARVCVCVCLVNCHTASALAENGLRWQQWQIFTFTPVTLHFNPGRAGISVLSVCARVVVPCAFSALGRQTRPKYVRMRQRARAAHCRIMRTIATPYHATAEVSAFARVRRRRASDKRKASGNCTVRDFWNMCI